VEVTRCPLDELVRQIDTLEAYDHESGKVVKVVA
jgi:hypothetical protein